MPELDAIQLFVLPLAVAAVAFLSEFVYASLNNVIVPLFLDREAARLGISHARLGWALGSAIATFLAVETLMRIPAGALSDRFGRRAFIAGAPLLTCLSPVLLAQVSAFWMVYPLRVVDAADHDARRQR